MEVSIAKCADCGKMIAIVDSIRFGHKCSGLFHDVKGLYWKSSHPLESELAAVKAKNEKLWKTIQKTISQIDTSGYTISIGEIRLTLEQALKQKLEGV